MLLTHGLRVANPCGNGHPRAASSEPRSGSLIFLIDLLGSVALSRCYIEYLQECNHANLCHVNDALRTRKLGD